MALKLSSYADDSESGGAEISLMGLFRFATRTDRWIVFGGIVSGILAGCLQPLPGFLSGKMANLLINYGQKQQHSDQLIHNGMIVVVATGIIGLGLVITTFMKVSSSLRVHT